MVLFYHLLETAIVVVLSLLIWQELRQTHNSIKLEIVRMLLYSAILVWVLNNWWLFVRHLIFLKLRQLNIVQRYWNLWGALILASRQIPHLLILLYLFNLPLKNWAQRIDSVHWCHLHCSVFVGLWLTQVEIVLLYSNWSKNVAVISTLNRTSIMKDLIILRSLNWKCVIILVSMKKSSLILTLTASYIVVVSWNIRGHLITVAIRVEFNSTPIKIILILMTLAILY